MCASQKVQTLKSILNYSKSIQYSNFVKTKSADEMPRALEKEIIDSAMIVSHFFLAKIHLTN